MMIDIAMNPVKGRGKGEVPLIHVVLIEKVKDGDLGSAAKCCQPTMLANYRL